MIDLPRLRAFVTVVRTGSVTRAALELGISQSPLSRQILTLEGELGFSLFDREGRGLVLSEAGRAFLPEAERLLASAASVASRARAIAGGELGRIAIGYVEGAVYAGVVGRALARLRRHDPGCVVSLMPLGSAAQVDGIREGSLDVAFVHTPPRHATDLVVTRVANEPFVVVAPRKGPFGKERSVRRLLHAAPIVRAPDDGASEGSVAFRRAAIDLGVRWDEGIRARDPAVVLALVAAGAGVGIVQESLRDFSPSGVRFLSLPKSFPLELEVHRITRGSPSPAVRALTGVASRNAPRSGE